MRVFSLYQWSIALCLVGLMMSSCGKSSQNSILGEWVIYGDRVEITQVGENLVLNLEDGQFILAEENGRYSFPTPNGKWQIIFDSNKDELLVNTPGRTFSASRLSLDAFVGYWRTDPELGGPGACAEITREGEKLNISYSFQTGMNTEWIHAETDAIFEFEQKSYVIILGSNRLEMSFPHQGESKFRVPSLNGNGYTSFMVSRTEVDCSK